VPYSRGKILEARARGSTEETGKGERGKGITIKISCVTSI